MKRGIKFFKRKGGVNKSIKGRLMFALFVGSALLLSITGLIIINTVNNNFNENAESVLYEKSYQVSNEAALFFERYVTLTQQMAQDKNLQNFLVTVNEREDILSHENFEVVMDTLRGTQKSHEDVIMAAYIGEADPSYVLSNLTALSDIYFDMKTRDYYSTITDGLINITEPYVDYGTGKMVVTITTPVYVDGKVVGLTGLDIIIDAMSTVVGNAKIGEDGYFSLLTRDNIIVSHKDSDNILKSINDIGISKTLLDNIINDSDEVVEYTYNNETFIGNIAKIGNSDWKILSAMPKNEFIAKTKDLVSLITIIYIITIAVLSVAMYIIVGRITRPITKITDITNRMAEGQLDVSISINTNDEIGRLAKSVESLAVRLKSYIEYINESVFVLNEISQGNLVVEFKNDYSGEFAKLKSALLNVSNTLKDAIGRIKISAQSITMNAEQVSVGAQTLAQGTTEQASAIEELSAEINEIYQTIVHNAEYAENAGKKAMEAAKEVEAGNHHMRDMLAAMDEISSSSSEIGKIIKVIDDIAFQTNILALNAAVEAARAGSAGKGFAVVADEVRNLAQKSAEAAKQTTALIENSLRSINKGTLLADEAGKSLAGIVSITNETNSLISEIANASSQQTLSVNQIRSGIEQISSVVQENAATAEASAANSEELSGQANLLNELVNKFKIEEAEEAF